jgi:hypothetical protein
VQTQKGMSLSFARPVIAAAALAGLLALSACATPVGGSPDAAPPSPAASAPVDVVGTGTVLERDGEVRLCFIVAESYPPQCGGGVALGGWSWEGVEGSETASGVQWGSYAVRGFFDGETLAVSEAPQLLALYDPAPYTPSDDPVQQGLDERFGEGALRVVGQ